MLTWKEDFDVTLLDHCGTDEDIAKAARISTTGKIEASEYEGLIRYLAKHRHGTPFEHVFMKFSITAPIFVWREFHRHRIGFSYNEESARYKTLEPVFYLPPLERPMQKVDGFKPARPEFESSSSRTISEVRDNLVVAYTIAYQNYLDNLNLGIDPGLARACLPVGIYSSCIVSCNARSLMHFLSLRTRHDNATFKSYPLWEIEQVAKQLEEHFEKLFPVTYKAFCDFGRVSP